MKQEEISFDEIEKAMENNEPIDILDRNAIENKTEELKPEIEEEKASQETHIDEPKNEIDELRKYLEEQRLVNEQIRQEMQQLKYGAYYPQVTISQQQQQTSQAKAREYFDKSKVQELFDKPEEFLDKFAKNIHETTKQE